MKKKSKRGGKQKLEIVFDPKSRREFLTGFRKRKNERRKRAKEELERLLKDEKKRIKQEIKEGVKHLERSYKPIPEVEEFLENEKETEDDEVVVKVTELSMKEIAEKENWLGENHPRYSNNENCEDDNSNNSNHDHEIINQEEGVPGMSLFQNEEDKIISKELISDKKVNEVKTKKDINRIKQKRMLKSMKSSKVFKMKRNYDRLVNKKKVKKDKNKQLRQLRKEGKKNPRKYLAMQKAKRKSKKQEKQRTYPHV